MTPCIVFIATAWGLKLGGVNSFNMDLCTAVAAALKKSHAGQAVRVVCLVTSITDADEKDARRAGVHLIAIPRAPKRSDNEKDSRLLGDNAVVAAVVAALKNADLSPGLWIGHDVITGSLAVAMRDAMDGRLGIVFHFEPDLYFPQEEKDPKPDITVQERLGKAADWCFGVGPSLRDMTITRSKRPDRVRMLLPGILPYNKRLPGREKTRFSAIVFGRLDPSNDIVKQGRLAVRAFADLCEGWPDERDKPKLIVRGLDVKNFEKERREILDLSRKYAGARNHIDPKPFSDNRAELLHELASQHACIVPSWVEGFGLTAWESIAVGTPLVLSTGSGAFRFLKDNKLEKYVRPVRIAGAFQENDVKAVSTALREIADNLPLALRRADELRHKLRAPAHGIECTWAGTAAQLLEPFGVLERGLPEPDEREAPSSPKPGGFIAGNTVALASLCANLRLLLYAIVGTKTATLQQIEDRVWPLGGGGELARVLQGQARTPADLRLGRLCAELARLGVLGSEADVSAFLRAAPSDRGFAEQSALTAQRRTPAVKRLAELVQVRNSFSRREWLKPLRGRLNALNEESDTYWEQLQPIYYEVSTHMDVDQMRDAALLDFGLSGRWGKFIDVDPTASPQNHLTYSSLEIGAMVAGRIVDAARSRIESRTDPEAHVIRILEGGVGGGQTAYFMIDAIHQEARRRNLRVAIRYAGFELVPDLAAEVDGWMRGVSSSPKYAKDPRFRLFSSLSSLDVLRPLTPDSSFVHTDTMENGLAALAAQSQWLEAFDLFVTSYAFHHVPNTDAIFHFFSGEGTPWQTPLHMVLAEEPHLRLGYSPLSEFRDPVRKGIRDTILRAIERLRGEQDAAAQYTILQQERESITEYDLLPARVFLSLFEPMPMHSDYDRLIAYLRGPIERKWKIPIEGDGAVPGLITLLRNPQTDVLSCAAQLLRPGGILAIADPDGTSRFNAKMLPKDVEMSVANFVSGWRLSETLKKSLAPAWTSVKHFTVREEPGQRLSRTPGGPRPTRRDMHDAELDVNKGFILTAQRSGPVAYGEIMQ